MNNHYANSCGCNSPKPPAPPVTKHYEKSLAMAYVPWQTWNNVMDGCNGLKHGTIFKDLVLSFEGSKAACAECGNNHNNYRRGMR